MTRPLLFPIIVPRSYFDLGNFPGSKLDLRHPELSVTWVELEDEGSMTYVNHEREAQLANSTKALHELALGDLRAAGSLFSHKKEIDGHCLWMAMNHDDGLGTSRLLLLREIQELFPKGFKFGIPERSCGIVVPDGLSEEQQSEGRQLVTSCYGKGAVPMLDDLFDPSYLELADA